VPADITLDKLHEVIEIVMGWMVGYPHQFILRDKNLKPSVQEMALWFRQNAWDEDFLGRIRGERYFVTKVTSWRDPMEMEGKDKNAVTLGELCPKVKSKLIYEHDFGDGWEHSLAVQKIIEPKPGVRHPVCLVVPTVGLRRCVGLLRDARSCRRPGPRAA